MAICHLLLYKSELQYYTVISREGEGGAIRHREDSKSHQLINCELLF